CNAKFKDKATFKLHLKKHNGQIVKKHCCSKCGKKFSEPGKLKNHEAAVHGGELKHICDVCGKAFAIYNYLYIHLRSHETPEQKAARNLKAKLAAEARR